MNSLESLKDELLKQKQILISKGIGVIITGRNPSPTDITNSLNEMNIDFPSATATTDDVRIGKTFFSQNSELKTGTLDTSAIDTYQNQINTFITGIGSIEIKIPEDTTQIREYAFYNGDFTDNNAFYKENLVIPATVTQIGAYAFKNCNVSGKLVIPSTCKKLREHAFAGTAITELEINSGINADAMYAFSACPSLKKVVVNQRIYSFSTYIFYKSTALEELYLPSSLTSLSYNCINGCTGLKMIEFTSENPPTIESGAFSKCKTANLIVPYLSYDAYINTTNFQAYANPVYGFGVFSQGDTLPTEITSYTLVWYATLEDCIAQTNPITTSPHNDKIYASLTLVS